MILYSETTSPYSAVVRVAIYAKGAAVEIEPPPGARRFSVFSVFSVVQSRSPLRGDWRYGSTFTSILATA